MINFYRINEQGYPEVGSGKTLPDGYKEFEVEVAEDGSKTYSPVELNDAMVLMQEQETTAKQIAEAKEYLNDTMWINDKYTDVVLINKLMTDEEYKDKYSLEYQKRAEARALINILEG